jgi:uncharacterized protein YbjQ (UPF0145 family)
VLVVTTDEIAGYEISQVLGEVLGVIACSRNPFEAGLASPDGKAKGDIPSILVHTRSKAVANMIHAAEHRGANAVVGMRFDHRDISNHWIELCAYGTAVVASAPPARPRKSGQSTDHRTG